MGIAQLVPVLRVYMPASITIVDTGLMLDSKLVLGLHGCSCRIFVLLIDLTYDYCLMIVEFDGVMGNICMGIARLLSAYSLCSQCGFGSLEGASLFADHKLRWHFSTLCQVY